MQPILITTNGNNGWIPNPTWTAVMPPMPTDQRFFAMFLCNDKYKFFSVTCNTDAPATQAWCVKLPDGTILRALGSNKIIDYVFTQSDLDNNNTLVFEIYSENPGHLVSMSFINNPATTTDARPAPRCTGLVYIVGNTNMYGTIGFGCKFGSSSFIGPSNNRNQNLQSIRLKGTCDSNQFLFDGCCALQELKIERFIGNINSCLSNAMNLIDWYVDEWIVKSTSSIVAPFNNIPIVDFSTHVGNLDLSGMSYIAGFLNQSRIQHFPYKFIPTTGLLWAGDAGACVDGYHLDMIKYVGSETSLIPNPVVCRFDTFRIDNMLPQLATIGTTVPAPINRENMLLFFGDLLDRASLGLPEGTLRIKNWIGWEQLTLEEQNIPTTLGYIVTT